MKALIIVSSAEAGFWLSELTHPYWHLAERGVEIDIASPKGGKTQWNTWSDPYTDESQEPDDLVSKGFLSDKNLSDKVVNTLALSDLDLDNYDLMHVVGGGGAAFDLYPSDEMTRVLEHFFAKDKVVGVICHGAIALGNVPSRAKGRRATGFSMAEDEKIQALLGKDFIPNFPQPVMEKAGIVYSSVAPGGVHVVVDGKLVTGQNQQSASEYALALYHVALGSSPVVIV